MLRKLYEKRFTVWDMLMAVGIACPVYVGEYETALLFFTLAMIISQALEQKISVKSGQP